MSSSKIERAIHGPSWTEVFLGAGLSVVLGVVLAAAHLVIKPVQTVKELPKEPVEGQVYFIEGKKDSSRGSAWLQKQQALREGRSIELTEDELNTAVATPMGKAKKGEAADSAPSSEALFARGAVNFHILQNALQVSIPVKVTPLDMTLIVQAKGVFVRSGEQLCFEPETFYVGSCPIHRLPVIGGMILKRVYSAQSVPQDLEVAWKKVTAVELDGKVLKLSL